MLADWKCLLLTFLTTTKKIRICEVFFLKWNLETILVHPLMCHIFAFTVRLKWTPDLTPCPKWMLPWMWLMMRPSECHISQFSSFFEIFFCHSASVRWAQICEASHINWFIFFITVRRELWLYSLQNVLRPNGTDFYRKPPKNLDIRKCYIV